MNTGPWTVNVDPATAFPHRCPGKGCAICAWLLARTWQALLSAKAKKFR